jgi:hypothetical protein
VCESYWSLGPRSCSRVAHAGFEQFSLCPSSRPTPPRQKCGIQDQRLSSLDRPRRHWKRKYQLRVCLLYGQREETHEVHSMRLGVHCTGSHFRRSLYLWHLGLCDDSRVDHSLDRQEKNEIATINFGQLVRQ